jgi:hypothetical protein
MKSKLLQKKSDSLDRSDEVLADQHENIEDSSEPLEATRKRKTQSTWLLMPRPFRKHSSRSGGLTFDQDAEGLLRGAPVSPAAAARVSRSYYPGPRSASWVNSITATRSRPRGWMPHIRDGSWDTRSIRRGRRLSDRMRGLRSLSRPSASLAGLAADSSRQRSSFEGGILRRRAACLCETCSVCLHSLVFLQPLKRLPENLCCPDMRRHDDAVMHPFPIASR